MAPPVPVTYTFGNHMHWVDMQWLWGYHVLPGSVRDMIRFCRETASKGCINFDGIGYEKLAAESPDTLSELRQAVSEGWIEPVGCSYGQPYGQFHGGESNVRQRVYGARVVRRLLGIWPRTFWEEEFDFFPQLPQLLCRTGFEGASLFFQWTWHTPELPMEPSPVVWWEGLDGSRLLAATRNRLNLHQWPEDFQLLLEDLATRGPEALMSSSSSHQGTLPSAPLLVQQWLELMPSPDWMCRAELMVPKLLELKQDSRFQVDFATMGEYLDRARTYDAPTRRYEPDEVWHGLTLGKNGDHMRRESARAERELLNAEALASVASLFGRPYAQWDVYPTWELEEAWRELLAAQHHDNCECEGLCGRFGKLQYERARGIAEETIRRTLKCLDLELDKPGLQAVDFNPFGWATPSVSGARTVPPYSFVPSLFSARSVGQRINEADRTMIPAADEPEIDFEVDLSRGVVTRLSLIGKSSVFGEHGSAGTLTLAGSPLETPECQFADIDGQHVWAHYGTGEDWDRSMRIQRSYPHAGLDLEFEDIRGLLDRVTPGFQGALCIHFPSPCKVPVVHSDSPYAVGRITSGSSGRRKYPHGDWMTSAQWFEQVDGAFTSLSLVDLCDPESGDGLLIVHSGFQQWFLEDGGVRCVLAANDPWDEGYFSKPEGFAASAGDDTWRMHGGFRLVPHGPITNATRWKMAQEFRRGHEFLRRIATSRRVPEGFCFLQSTPDNVVVTALYREEGAYAGAHLPSYAGAGIEHPFVLRLVEFDGVESEVTLSIAGPVARAFKTDLLGGNRLEVKPQEGDPQFHCARPEDLRPYQIEPSTLTFAMRPYEIATLYLDIVPGRKQVRDLDSKREVWATVHREGGV